MKTQKTRQQRKKSAYDWFLRVTLCVFIIIAIVLVGMQIRSKYVFLQNTFINQVNCSNLSVKQAEKKIKKTLPADIPTVFISSVTGENLSELEMTGLL